MASQARNFEKRRFGRRRLTCHAWIKVGRKQPQACIVRNISKQGALLEFIDEAPKAPSFRLIIDDANFEAMCEVKHRRAHAAGVYFVAATEAVAPAQITANTGHKLVASIRAAKGEKA